MPGNRREFTQLILGTCLLLCLFAGIMFMVIRWHAGKMAELEISQLSDAISACASSPEYVQRLCRLDSNALLNISCFSKDVSRLHKGSPALGRDLLQDMEFALKSNTRIENIEKGYEVIPSSEAVVVISTNRDLLWQATTGNWLVWALALLSLLTITFSFAFFLLRPRSQMEGCRPLLSRIAGVSSTSNTKDLKELLRLAMDRFKKMENELAASKDRCSRLKEEADGLRRSLRKVTQDLEATQEYLLRAGTLTALGEFAAGISHELNNPMGIVLGFTQHLLDEVPVEHAHYPKLKRMEQELIRCQKILQDLLAFARPQEPVFRKIDVNSLVKETVQFVFYPPVKGIEVVCNLAEDLPEIQADPDQLEQILINLIKNAKESIEKEGQITITTGIVTLTREDVIMLNAPVVQSGTLLMEDPGSALSLRIPRVKTNMKPGDQAVEIEVTDTGCGISQEEIEKIFRPFYTTKKEGTGLGLSICWKLIRRNRGILKVTSIHGQGSTFSIIFPIKNHREKDE